MPPATNGVNSKWQWINGSSHSQVQNRRRPDIGEKKMDEEVHGFASDNVDVLPSLRKDGAPAYNGSGEGAFPPAAFTQKNDIANKEVRPDVWVEVHKMINPASVHRAPNPPKPTYIPAPPAGGYPKEPEAPNPTPKEADEHEKKAKAPPEPTEEEVKAKKEPVPVKKEPDNEPGDLDPPVHEEADEDDDKGKKKGKDGAFIMYDAQNNLWRNFVQLQ